MSLIRETCRGQLQITSSGFQFLLHTPHAQLWELLLQYLQMVEVRQVFLIVLRRLINQSGFTPGKANGPSRSAQLLVHVINYGAWKSESTPRPSPIRRIDRSYHQEYSTENLSDTQRAMLEDLRDYGLIWQRKAKHVFCVFSNVLTHNTTGIVSSLQPDTPGNDADIFTSAAADSR
jgi:transcription initiation factor TFIIH subunit 4